MGGINFHISILSGAWAAGHICTLYKRGTILGILLAMTLFDERCDCKRRTGSWPLLGYKRRLDQSNSSPRKERVAEKKITGPTLPEFRYE